MNASNGNRLSVPELENQIALLQAELRRKTEPLRPHGMYACSRCGLLHQSVWGCGCINATREGWESANRWGGVTQWMPMDSAPKDGTPVLLLCRDDIKGGHWETTWNGRMFVGSNRKDSSEWGFAAPVGMGGFPDESFAGWMPLPAPPVADPGQAGCAHHFVLDDEHLSHECCQKCGQVRRVA